MKRNRSFQGPKSRSSSIRRTSGVATRIAHLHQVKANNWINSFENSNQRPSNGQNGAPLRSTSPHERNDTSDSQDRQQVYTQKANEIKDLTQGFLKQARRDSRRPELPNEDEIQSGAAFGIYADGSELSTKNYHKRQNSVRSPRSAHLRHTGGETSAKFSKEKKIFAQKERSRSAHAQRKSQQTSVQQTSQTPQSKGGKNVPLHPRTFKIPKASLNKQISLTDMYSVTALTKRTGTT